MEKEQTSPEVETNEDSRYESFPTWLKVIFVLMTSVGIVISVFYLYSIRISGVVINQVTYFYVFIAIFLPGSILILPASKKKGARRIRWYDLFLALTGFCIAIYFSLNEYEISQIGWSRPPDHYKLILAILFGALLLEAGRRLAGNVFLAVNLLIGLYPLIADRMPGILYGKSFRFADIVGRNVFGYDGVIGLPSIVVAELLLGFLIFAGILIASGAGSFFLDLSLSLLGKYRGGPAKVAIISSAFFGSLSGNPLANIVGTGSVTIPAMKKMGVSRTYAGAIEACASTGGILMPPVMGAVAFIMAGFLGVDYSVIITIAIIPSFLYFFGLIMQVDAYAAKLNLQGLSKEEIPHFLSVLKEGWPFIIILAFLVWGLAYMKWSTYTPYYASALMIVLSSFNRKTRFTVQKFIDSIATVGKLLSQTSAALLPMCFVLVGLVSTGISGAFTSTLISATGGNIILILLAGVIACYILGMAGLVVPAYIFLSLSMAPAAVKAGDLNILAVHIFIIYYALIGGITPPVAPGAFVAATLSGASPMKTAVICMRLGVVLYFIPFFFIFNPAMILQGPLLESLYLFVFCLVGIVLIAAGFEGYLIKMGLVESWLRPFLVLAGFLIAFPEWRSTAAGFVIALLALPIMTWRKKAVAEMGTA